MGESYVAPASTGIECLMARVQEVSVEASSVLPPARTVADQEPARVQQRRAIDAVLAAEARQHPAFAHAKRSAVLAMYEERGAALDAPGLLRDLRFWESARGSRAAPDERAIRLSNLPNAALAAYERARGGRIIAQPPEVPAPVDRAAAIRRAFPSPEQSLAEAYGSKS